MVEEIREHPELFITQFLKQHFHISVETHYTQLLLCLSAF